MITDRGVVQTSGSCKARFEKVEHLKMSILDSGNRLFSPARKFILK